MTKLADKNGRQISLTTLVDRERGRVQVIRQLHNTKGFLVDSGNMGWIPIEEWREFLRTEKLRAREKPPTLYEQWFPGTTAERGDAR